MPDIVVDGVRYVPEGNEVPRIGVGITTKDRSEVFRKSYAEIVRHTPGAKIVVVDDASTKPVSEADFRFDKTAGIARAKNKCLELLSDCEHIFLFDDDTYPLTSEWWVPYVESPEPHLMYIFENVNDVSLGDLDLVYQDSEYKAYSHARGVMLYAHRSVLDAVGGMDSQFGQWGYEHVDWSNRIHAAGLTTWRFADVVGSDKLFCALDERLGVKRTVDAATRDKLVARNAPIKDAQMNLAAYREFRETRDAVITVLFTKQVDPQRGLRMKADSSALSALRKSLGSREIVILHDELKDTSSEFVQVETSIQPYFQRWVSAWRYLRDHPEIRNVWCVDGTDVEMLRDPFPEMEAGKLYLGSEPTVIGSDWMVKNHPAVFLQGFMLEHAHRQLLNAGLVGGDRETVMAFLHDIVRTYFDHHDQNLGVGDMATLNYVAYTKYADRLVYGPRINTVFKAEEKGNKTAWWKHK